MTLNEENDRLSKLKPIGEMKVVSIPFGGPEHYAFSIRPGNSVWGKSWAKTRGAPNGNSFPLLNPIQKLGENQRNPQIPSQMDKPPEPPLMDIFTKNTSHVIIGISLLVLIILVMKKFQ